MPLGRSLVLPEIRRAVQPLGRSLVLPEIRRAVQPLGRSLVLPEIRRTVQPLGRSLVLPEIRRAVQRCERSDAGRVEDRGLFAGRSRRRLVNHPMVERGVVDGDSGTQCSPPVAVLRAAGEG